MPRSRRHRSDRAPGRRRRHRHRRGAQARSRHRNAAPSLSHQQPRAPLLQCVRAPSRPVANAPASAPAPRARALIIGINYVGSRLALSGCANDAVNLLEYVRAEARKANVALDVRVLCDDRRPVARGGPRFAAGEVHGAPTRAAIIAGLRWLADGATAASRMWLSYSGHGSRQRDADGSESDGFDETIVPADYARSGVIVDDELRATLIDRLPEGARLTAVLDCCHSGTGLDLRYTCRDASAPLPAFVDANGALTPRARRHFDRRHWTQRTEAHECTKEAATRAHVTMVSGCRDAQTSADAWEEGASTGALTYALLRYVASRRHRRARAAERTPRNVLADMACWLRTRGYTQQPVLSFGRHDDYDASATQPWAPFSECTPS